MTENEVTQEGARIPRILIAEDDPVNQQVLGLMLKRSNFNVDVAGDGLNVIKMWEKGDYDLVLMDIQMPHLDGLEATRIIREKELAQGRHTAIIAITAHSRKKEDCFAAGMDAYISKPIDFKKTLQVIKDILKQESSGYV